MIEQPADMMIGISAAMREHYTANDIATFVTRATSGDPGDGPANDLNDVMGIVSADMDGTQSHRLFGDPPDVHCFFRPQDEHALFIHNSEIHSEGMDEALKTFGFNPATLQPL